MFYTRLQIIYCTCLLLLETRFLHAQNGVSPSINEDGKPNLVKSRVFGLANMGFPNFAPERFGNLGSNYPPGSPFFPFGNQFPNFPRSGPDYGWDLQNQDPNQRILQGPQRGLTQNQRDFPDHRGIFRPGVNGIFDPATYSRDTKQNSPRASVPDDVSLFRVNRPHQSEGSSQPGQSNPGEALQYSTLNGNPVQDSNFVADSKYYPNTRSQLPYRPIDYPMKNNLYPDNNRVYQNPDRNNFLNPRNPNFESRSNTNTLSSYTSDLPNTQNPQNNLGRLKVNQPVHSINQNPTNLGMENIDGSNFNEGNFNDVPQTIPKLPDPDSRETDSERKVAILGKPVIVPPDSTEASDVDVESLKIAVQKQCVQDCETTSEYNPICGTNYVTYINPEKFTCARNCGVDVHISRYGRCNDGPASHYARQ